MLVLTYCCDDILSIFKTWKFLHRHVNGVLHVTIIRCSNLRKSAFQIWCRSGSTFYLVLLSKLWASLTFVTYWNVFGIAQSRFKLLEKIKKCFIRICTLRWKHSTAWRFRLPMSIIRSSNVFWSLFFTFTSIISSEKCKNAYAVVSLKLAVSDRKKYRTKNMIRFRHRH